MDEITTREENLPATLDSYAQQGRMFLFNAAQNLIQFGRVLIEAKPLVPRGQFEGWVKNNFGISERTAQGYMAVYRRFGVKEQYRNVQFSKLQEMLALPEGTEEQFSADHNLDDMSAREIKRAVQQAKAEAQAEIEKERTAHEAAEAKIREMESREPELPEDVIARMAGIQDRIGCHTLRKTFGYRYYKETGDVVSLQRILCHSSSRETLLYIGVIQEEINNSLRGFKTVW